MEADGVVVPLEDGGLEVVVQHASRHPAEGLEGADMALEEGAHSLIVEEPYEGHSRPRQHQNEGGDPAGRLSHHTAAEGAPVHLRLFATQRGQPLVRLGWFARPQYRHQPTEMALTAGVAPLHDHRVQSAGRKRRIHRQRLLDERQERIDHRRSTRRCHWHVLAVQHPLDGAVMHPHLAGDGSHRPLLHEVKPQDALFEVFGDHGVPPSSPS